MHTHCNTTYDVSQKPWGLQRPILRNDPLHVDEIEVVPGGYCSVHRHLKKVNLFHVLEGRLTVLCFNDMQAVVATYAMRAGDHCVIPAGVWHQFWSRSGCVAQEVYYGTEEQLLVVHGDIDRNSEFAVGGVAPLLAGVPSMRGIYLAEAGS